MKQELTTTSVTTALTTYTGTIISEESFAQLSDIIEKISSNKEELTDNMRQAATRYANDWDNLVVARLNEKVKQLDILTNFFNNKRPNYYSVFSYFKDAQMSNNTTIFISEITAMLRSGDNKNWHKIADKLDDIFNSIETLEDELGEAPDREDYFDEDERDMGYSDRIIAQKQYELDLAKYQKARYKKQLKIRTAFVKVHKEMLQDPDIKIMIKKIAEQRRAAKNAQSLVHEKTALVKLAINFSGTELLKALQELHEFQKKL